MVELLIMYHVENDFFPHYYKKDITEFFGTVSLLKLKEDFKKEFQAEHPEVKHYFLELDISEEEIFL